MRRGGKIDNTLFLQNQGQDLLTVQIYVYDIIFGGIDASLRVEFSKLMSNKLEMRMMGELTFFLGFQIKQSPSAKVHQRITKEI